MMKVCLLGASGSIGTQSIDVMFKNIKDFSLVGFSVGNQTRKIRFILSKFNTVGFICISNPNKAKLYQKKYPHIKFYSGEEGLNLLIKESNCDMVINALVGFVGLKPTLTALNENKVLALANKEALVVGGELVNDLLANGKGKLYPIDSEHVALSKCLAVEDKNVSKLIITASGGAFRNLSREQLNDVVASDALKHPTWKMGNKITIDCASMVNKTFEIIEAHYLFKYPFNKIDVILNYESYVHSLVQYNDGTYRMEVGHPDMRKPIKYALYQGLTPFDTIKTNSLDNLKNISFKPFDINRYPIVRYANEVIKYHGTYGAVLNASNEIAVYAFLENKIPFLAIEKIISKCMDEHKNILHPDYDILLKVDREIRKKAFDIIKKGEY